MFASAVRANGVPGSAVAFTADGRTWTRDDLFAAADDLGGALGREIPPGQPVALRLTDPAAAVVATLACDALGLAVVHVDPALPEPPPLATVTDDGLLPARAGATSHASRPPGSHTFLTSGSTGVPVGVVRSGEAVLADARRVAAFLGYRPDEPVLNATPLFHVYGFNYGLAGPLLTGAPVTFAPSRSVPSQLGRVAARSGAVTMIALPFHYGLLAGRALPDGFGGLRQAVSAGAPLADGAITSIVEADVFTLYNCYGSSEAGAITLGRLTGTEAPGTVGRPLPGVRFRVDPSVGPDGTGELLLWSDSLALGRLGPEGVRPLPGADGWFRTGDLVRPPGPDQVLQLSGRVNALINVAGEKVSPGDVERVLAAHPAVAETYVFASPDRARGQVPTALVVLRTPEPVENLVGWCRDKLAPHQVPRSITIVAELPRSATGKIVTGPIGGRS
ncbi:fatty acid--CoA ligase family protein [Actinoplanes sp. NBRC 103695]|uniref:class I adenylate-forming enzyme family protein n=1 Tax=Actinoplanes sp. NBRC 103695 TaxID=3032202 RepID=UPI0024A4ADEE|nr:fatty acid--CoA ligase family protein [Actinoplanes sp. NBRC 103695]GLZ01170.1 long-chain acyl-CoA synthetase [Actinoplanes sp. NBRC 103695]